MASDSVCPSFNLYHHLIQLPDKMAQRYMDDAAFLLQNAKAYDENAEFQVPRFKMSILIHEESGRRINEFTDVQSLSSPL